MKLLEFFGKPLNFQNQHESHNNELSKNDLFWFMIDNDRLHKKHFMPLAKKIKKQNSNGMVDKEKVLVDFMEMVKDGCKEYYTKNKMQGRLGKLFPKDLREEMCEKLFDHYVEDVIKDKYKLGQS